MLPDPDLAGQALSSTSIIKLGEGSGVILMQDAQVPICFKKNYYLEGPSGVHQNHTSIGPVLSVSDLNGRRSLVDLFIRWRGQYRYQSPVGPGPPKKVPAARPHAMDTSNCQPGRPRSGPMHSACLHEGMLCLLRETGQLCQSLLLSYAISIVLALPVP